MRVRVRRLRLHPHPRRQALAHPRLPVQRRGVRAVRRDGKTAATSSWSCTHRSFPADPPQGWLHARVLQGGHEHGHGAQRDSAPLGLGTHARATKVTCNHVRVPCSRALANIPFRRASSRALPLPPHSPPPRSRTVRHRRRVIRLGPINPSAARRSSPSRARQLGEHSENSSTPTRDRTPVARGLRSRADERRGARALLAPVRGRRGAGEREEVHSAARDASPGGILREPPAAALILEKKHASSEDSENARSAVILSRGNALVAESPPRRDPIHPGRGRPVTRSRCA